MFDLYLHFRKKIFVEEIVQEGYMKLVAKPKKKRKKKYSLSCDYILNISNKPKRMRREREKRRRNMHSIHSEKLGERWVFCFCSAQVHSCNAVGRFVELADFPHHF